MVVVAAVKEKVGGSGYWLATPVAAAERKAGAMRMMAGSTPLLQYMHREPIFSLLLEEALPAGLITVLNMMLRRNLGT